MKALTYHGPHSVRVENVPDPIIEHADDIILRITATAICGSDLHLYRGKIPQVKHGDIFGHEFMGEVVETGREVKDLRKGDRVVIPFVIACGDCFFCRMHQYAACETTNSGQGAALNKKQIPAPAALFGYSHLYGSVPGVYAGFIHGFLFGDAFDKGLTFKMGQTNVHAWLGELLPLIEQGLLTPEEIVTHYLPFEEAARGYEIFEKRQEECRKIILVPGAHSPQVAKERVTELVNAMPPAATL